MDARGNTDAMISNTDAGSSTGRLVDAAYAALRQRILSVELLPGSTLPEARLTEMLRMSRTPLREAVSRLTFEGLVETLPRRGIRVMPITARDVREINEVLGCLEIEAVGSVAARKLAAAEIGALDGAIAEMDDTLASGDMTAWAEADFRFHRLLFDLSPNLHLRQTAYLYLDKANRARLMTLPLRRAPRYSNSNHAAVVEAIRRSDPETARDIHARHKQRWSGELDTLIERYPDLFDASSRG